MVKAKKTYKKGGKVDPNNPSEGRVAKRQTRRAKKAYKKFMKSPGGKQGRFEVNVGEIDTISTPNGRKQYKNGGKVFEEGGKMKKMKKKGAPQLAMSREKHPMAVGPGERADSHAITKKEKTRRDSYRRGRYIKKPLSVMSKSERERRRIMDASFEKGGKVVAQGADKKDVRREKKQDRIMRRKKS